MNYFLFLTYFVIGCLLITRIPFIKNAGISGRIILLLFLLKVFAGLALGLITHRYAPYNDYESLNNEGIIEYKLLFLNTHEFFTNIFHSPYQNSYGGFFNSVGSYWNDLRNNIIIKLLAVCDIFSHGNYYVNSLLFNFFGFFGHVALFRVFIDVYKNKKWQVITGCFLLPSALYFSSGIHKDLVIFTMLGLFCYALYFSFTQKFTWRRSVLLFISTTILFLTRNFVFVALIPAMIAFIICIKKNASPIAIFFSTYAMIFLSVLVLQLLVPSFQPLKIIIQRQDDFFDLPIAASQLNTSPLKPEIKSFVRNIPQAIDHGFLRPNLWEKKKIFLVPLAIELFCYEILFLAFIFMYRSNIHSNNPFTLMCLFFAVSMLMVIGYIITNTGSIVRYRSLYLPFIITPMLCSIQKRSNNIKI